jgi:hypothetical protein
MTTAGGDERDALLGLLASWGAKASEHRDAHANASVRLRRWHYMLGVPAIVLSSIVAMTVFATLQRSVSTEVAVGVGVLSVCAAILAACQTFLHCSDRAEAHRQASADYEGLAEKAALVSALYKTGTLEEDRLHKLREACSEVQTLMAQLATKRPEVSERDRRAKAAAVLASSVPSILPPAEPKLQVSSSLPPPAASAAFGSVPPAAKLPPASLPPATLPPLRPPPQASSSSRPLAASADASGRRMVSSVPPPPVERSKA